jgi:hypothetical protein
MPRAPARYDRRMLESPIESADPTPEPTLFSAYTRDHWSCLLYLESRVVDHGGMVARNQPQMNSDDWSAIDDFVRDGLLVWGGTGFNPVFSFTDAGWSVAHALRRLRADGLPHTTDRAAVARAAVLRVAEVERIRGQASTLPELPPHYGVSQATENDGGLWCVEHAYIDVGHGLDDIASRDEAVAAAWADFRESGDPWAAVLASVGEIAQLREQVAFHKGCAEAAAEQEVSDS